jgi:hypothetical protein
MRALRAIKREKSDEADRARIEQRNREIEERIGTAAPVGTPSEDTQAARLEHRNAKVAEVKQRLEEAHASLDVSMAEVGTMSSQDRKRIAADARAAMALERKLTEADEEEDGSPYGRSRGRQTNRLIGRILSSKPIKGGAKKRSSILMSKKRKF